MRHHQANPTFNSIAGPAYFAYSREMDSMLTPQKTDQGWVIEVPPEMTHALGVAEGSIAVLHAKAGQIEVEILPPPSSELRKSARRIYEKHKDAFDEMKRRGD